MAASLGIRSAEPSQATPPPVVAKLHAAAVAALHSPELKEKYLSQGGIAVGNSSEEFTAYVKSEIDRWGKVIATAGTKIK
jgi:tripartite-type tricarboxylate transporter receptor subunit TctC